MSSGGLPGTNVCDRHSALIPAVQAAAATRIQMSVASAAKRLLDWMQDDSVDVRERVRIANDLLERRGLAATSRHLIGVVTQDPVEVLFARILSDPSATYDPRQVVPVKSIEADLEAIEDGEVH